MGVILISSVLFSAMMPPLIRLLQLGEDSSDGTGEGEGGADEDDAAKDAASGGVGAEGGHLRGAVHRWWAHVDDTYMKPVFGGVSRRRR